jgi:superfamily II DNA/RNA helicase
MSDDNFQSLPGFIATAELEQAMIKDGIVIPTEPQRGAFEAILGGKHVVIDSGTGTGKTLAYLLPLLQRLRESPDGRVVCLAPAAELAVQTLNVVMRYKSAELNVGALVGGGNQRKQKDRIQKSTRLVVGTPGRVLEVIAERKLKGVTTFVLDEPEPILASKDAAFLLEVLSRPPRPQLIIAGATFGVNSERLIAHLMTEAVARVKTEERPLVGLITHLRLRVRNAGDRDLQLIRFLQQEKADRAIVYVNQPHLIRHVYRYLEENGIPTVSLSQDRTKQQCQQAIRVFSQGEAQVLLTTDRAATGIDIDSVPWVVHYEPPRSPQSYVHRAGRTGRAGKKGCSIALISDQERFILSGLEKELGISFEEFRV